MNSWTKTKLNIWDKYFPYIVTGIFLALSIVLIIRHEMWADEMWAWLIGSESSSVAELVSNMRVNQGHPYMWNAILYFISHFITDNPESMKVVHLTISTALVFLLLKYAPFNKIVRVAIVFGYFLFYEYSIISRNYALGILFIVIFCILYKNKYKNIIPICIVLFFMGQANFYSFIISMALFLMLAVELIMDRKYVVKNVNKAFIIVGVLIIICEIVFIYWQLGSQVPTVSQGSALQIFVKSSGEYIDSLKHISKSIIKTFIPIPVFVLNFWGNNLVVNYLSNYRFIYTFVISFILLLIPVFIMKKRAIILYASGILGMFCISIFLDPAYLRHFGHILLIFITCLWISNINRSDRYIINTKVNFIKIFGNIFLGFVLASSIIATPAAYYFDYKYPFSNGKYVAEYIEENFDKDNMVIVGYKDWAVQTIAGYLDKEMYYPNLKEVKKLVLMDDDRLIEESTEVIFQEADSFTRKNDTVLVIKYIAPVRESEIPTKYNFEMLDTEFDNSIVTSENYYLYLFDRERFLKKLSDMEHIINSTDFEKYFRPMNQCEFIKEKDGIRIKAYGDDPWFETTFSIEFYKKRPIIFYVNIDSYTDNEFRIFFKRPDRDCIIEDSIPFVIYKGNNNIYIRIPYSEDLEGLRIDPVNTDSDCIIREVKFYSMEVFKNIKNE